MAKYIALLRAVNVGGTGKLPMSDLKAMCADAGFSNVHTYIASGNVVFECKARAAKVKSDLEERLLAYAGTRIGVVIRTAAEMAAVLKANPFPKAAPKHTVAIFLDAPPPADALGRASGVKDEQMRLSTREIYVHYGVGMGKSKLKIPAAKTGTARNMNTIAKLPFCQSTLAWLDRLRSPTTRPGRWNGERLYLFRALDQLATSSDGLTTRQGCQDGSNLGNFSKVISCQFATN